MDSPHRLGVVFAEAFVLGLVIGYRVADDGDFAVQRVGNCCERTYFAVFLLDFGCDAVERVELSLGGCGVGCEFALGFSQLALIGLLLAFHTAHTIGARRFGGEEQCCEHRNSQ